MRLAAVISLLAGILGLIAIVAPAVADDPQPPDIAFAGNFAQAEGLCLFCPALRCRAPRPASVAKSQRDEASHHRRV
jgi:hypothetical protein